MPKQYANKLRGRSAIEAAHSGIATQDEVRLDSTISMLYGVESTEAKEIHVNYHIDKILKSLSQRATRNGMKRQTLAKRLQQLDISGMASQVAKGHLAEAAAVDALFRGLSRIESNGKLDDMFSIYG